MVLIKEYTFNGEQAPKLVSFTFGHPESTTHSVAFQNFKEFNIGAYPKLF